MTNIPTAIYRSMIRISKKNDAELVNYLKSGLSTLNDSKSQMYDCKYIRDDKLFFIYGPYANETANMLSYTKCLIRDGKKTDYTMERLFLAHRELPNFFIAKENLDKQDNQDNQDNTELLENKTTSFGTSFF